MGKEFEKEKQNKLHQKNKYLRILPLESRHRWDSSVGHQGSVLRAPVSRGCDGHF